MTDAPLRRGRPRGVSPAKILAIQAACRETQYRIRGDPARAVPHGWKRVNVRRAAALVAKDLLELGFKVGKDSSTVRAAIHAPDVLPVDPCSNRPASIRHAAAMLCFRHRNLRRYRSLVEEIYSWCADRPRGACP
jgi:hypothetical protein